MRKIYLIAFLLVAPGCLDSTPEELTGIQIQLPLNSVVEGDLAIFSAAGEKPNGAKYLWDFGDGSGGTGETVQHVFGDEGKYSVILTVVDGQGRIGIAEEEIEILHRNEAPMASLLGTYEGNGQSVKVNSLVFFDGGSSLDPDGDVLTFTWDFGDGNTGEGIRPNHFYQSVGNFTVTLAVTDTGNLSSTAETWVLVSMRTFSISFQENTVAIPTLLGYNSETEGDETLEQHNYPYNITNVRYNLQWNEDEVVDEGQDVLNAPDNFTLTVRTNYLFNSTDSQTSGEITLNFNDLSTVPDDFVVSLTSKSEVWNYLFDTGYTSAKGQGPWVTSIICNEAPSVLDLGDTFSGTILDNDTGNDWFLDVVYWFYTATITEL